MGCEVWGDACRETARHHRGLLWALLAGAAAMVLVVGLLVFKLEDSSGRITSSPSSACSYAGASRLEEPSLTGFIE